MNRIQNTKTSVRRFVGISFHPVLVLLGVMLLAASTQAQNLRFQRPAPLRLTVSVNSTNTSTLTNLATLSGVVSDVTLSVSNLPAGCGYDLATNGVNVGTSVNITNDWGITVTVKSTNVTQGEYTFWLVGEGGATNRIPYVLQSCYIWTGTNNNPADPYTWTNNFNVTYNWTNSTSWVGGNYPTTNSANDVFFGDLGGQTNRNVTGSFTNIQIDNDVTVGSMRFGQGTYTNLYIEAPFTNTYNISTNFSYSTNNPGMTNELIITNIVSFVVTNVYGTNIVGATNAFFHHVRINNNRTLNVTGAGGFRLLRDHISEYGDNAGSKPDRKTGVFFSGGNGARLVVSNLSANFAILLDGGSGSGESFVSMTNIGNFFATVNRIGLGDYQLYPNYRALNADGNGLGSVPRRLISSIYLARTNYILAGFKDPDNYTNVNTRAYALNWMNSETSGVGSGTANFLQLGITNRFLADAINFVGGNHSSGNAGFLRFNPDLSSSGAVFRNTNGSSRMSLFSVSDGGGTNAAGSNMKATINLATGAGTPLVDILTDRLYVARDRQQISDGQTVNVEGDLILGRGFVNANTTILGFQEHDGKTNLVTYLGYCRGRLVLTNQCRMTNNGQFTLGYTADTGSLGLAEQFRTHGRLTINTGSSLNVSNIIVDGGPRNYSHTEGTDREDFISLNGGTLTVSNTIGALPGQPLDLYSTERSTNVFFVSPSRTNLVCRELATPGTDASLIRVAGLSGVSSYPATVPIIKYETAVSPYLKADVTAVTNLVPGLNGYLLNNSANSTIDIFLTTNAPKSLRWTGSINNNWDTNTFNWVTLVGSIATNFTIGDSVLFDDSSAVTNVIVVGEVVPGQAGVGVTFNNSTNHYILSGGAVAGTSSLLKTGSKSLTVTATKQGTLTILEGSLEVGVGGVVGFTTVATNIPVNVLGTINGGLSLTGMVTVVSGGVLAGPITMNEGTWIDNSGTVSTAPGALVTGDRIFLTNRVSATINVGGAAGTQWNIFTNSVLENNGVINNLVGRLNVYGFMYGNGTVSDPDSTGGAGGGFPAGIDGRLELRNPNGVLSPGSTATNSIGTLNVFTRFDIDGVNAQGWGTLLIEVDKSNPQTNDQVACDYWSNIQGKIAIRNISTHPTNAFAHGDAFRVLVNNNGPTYFNQPDNTFADHPLMDPIIPGPGLMWDLTDFRNYGIIRISTNRMVWRGIVNNTWDLSTTNWMGGAGLTNNIAFTNTLGAVFDDTALTNNVVLSSIVAPGGYSVTTNIPTPGTTNIFTNSVGISPGIFVNTTNTYFFSSTSTNTIEGWTGLYKTGSGTLDLGSMSNRFTGQVIVDQGTLVVSVYTNSGTPGPLGAPNVAPDNRQPATSERLILSGGATLRYTGVTATGDRAMTIGAGGAFLDVSNSTADLTISGVIRGEAGAVTKVGAGSLTLRAANSFTNLTHTSGRLRLADNNAAGRGYLLVTGGSLGFTNNTSMTNIIDLSVNTTVDNTNSTVVAGPWIGAGNVTLTNYTASVFSWSGAMSNYTGNITIVGGGTNRFNHQTNVNRCVGSAATLFDLGASARLENFNGGETNGLPLTYHLGGLAGGAGSSLAGRFSNDVAASGSIYSIGAKGVDTTFAGSILNGIGAGTVSIVKVGGGILALNGVNTYTGTTTVSNGTLGGTGSVVSVVTVTSGGTFAPGNSVGTFTVSNNATLGGTTLLELNPAGSDLLRVTGVLTGGGTLTVTNIGSTLTNGTVFQLFSQPASGFTATNLPAGYVWNNNIAANGSITVVSGGITVVNTTPTNIISSVSGNQLTLSWPSDRTGWTLQTQTNLLSVGLTPATNTWFGVAGSAATNTVVMTIDPTQPTVFYRLVYP